MSSIWVANGTHQPCYHRAKSTTNEKQWFLAVFNPFSIDNDGYWLNWLNFERSEIRILPPFAYSSMKLEFFTNTVML